MPWSKLWEDDLKRDCSVLSPSARGVWVWIFLDLRHHGGSRTLSLTEWARIAATSERETETALTEIIEHDICDSSISEALRGALRSNGTSQFYNGQVTVSCRRLIREAKELGGNALRQDRFRRRHASNGKNNGRVTPQRKEAEAKKQGKRESARKRVTHPPVPDPFVITKELREWAAQEAAGIDLEHETKKFVQKHKSKGSRFPDWSSTWKWWILLAVEFASQKVSGKASNARQPDLVGVEVPGVEVDQEALEQAKRLNAERERKSYEKEAARIRAIPEKSRSRRDRQWLESFDRNRSEGAA